VLHSDNNFDPVRTGLWVILKSCGTEKPRLSSNHYLRLQVRFGTASSHVENKKGRGTNAAASQIHGKLRGARPGQSSPSSSWEDGLAASWLQACDGPGSAGLGVAQVGAGAALTGSCSTIGAAGSE
jgi:hypothetical protein